MDKSEESGSKYEIVEASLQRKRIPARNQGDELLDPWMLHAKVGPTLRNYINFMGRGGSQDTFKNQVLLFAVATEAWYQEEGHGSVFRKRYFNLCQICDGTEKQQQKQQKKRQLPTRTKLSASKKSRPSTEADKEN